MNFSLYRGELHKVPDVPRRWSLSKPSMPLQTFRKLLLKREEALLLLATQPSPHSAAAAPDRNPETLAMEVEEGGGEGEKEAIAALATESLKRKRGELGEGDGDDLSGRREPKNPRNDPDSRLGLGSGSGSGSGSVLGLGLESGLGILGGDCDVEMEQVPSGGNETENCLGKDTEMGSTRAGELQHNNNNNNNKGAIRKSVEEVHGGPAEREEEKLEAPGTPAPKDEDSANPPCRAGLISVDIHSVRENEAACNTQKDKRREELEAKLKDLQEAKHKYVQMLKQLLQREEETKKRAQISTLHGAVSAGDSAMGQLEAMYGAVQIESRSSMDPSHFLDLEEGELEDTRTPSPLLVQTGLNATSHSFHSALSPSSLVSPINAKQVNAPLHADQVWKQRGRPMAKGFNKRMDSTP